MDLTMPRTLDELLRRALAVYASDLHITVESAPVVRVQGKVLRLDEDVMKRADTEALADVVLGEQGVRELVEQGEVSVSHSVSGLGRFRVTVYRQRGSIALSVHLVYPGIPSLEDTGLPPIVTDLTSRKEGLLLVAGPRGSGKTLVQAAMVDHINSTISAHVITIEDPVEYLHRHKKSIVNQREVGSDTKSFLEALKATMRLDPDVVSVGDIPDAETMSLCLEVANTGCLVIGSLRANGVEAAFRSILAMYSQERRPQVAALIAESLQGVVALQLYRSPRNPRPLSLCEVLINTPAVKELIKEERLHHIEATLRTGQKAGMYSFAASAGHLLSEGMVTQEEYDRIINSLSGVTGDRR
jgi:twitching motility protein PilT